MNDATVAGLIRLLPTLDLTWPPEWQTLWWQWFAILWTEARQRTG